jgi:superfamily II DNA or RNA helicase
MSTDKQEATNITTTFFHEERTIAVGLEPVQRFFLQREEQWYARLVNAFSTEVGVYYGGEKKVLPLTVTTSASAGDLMAKYGNAFKLIIFDESHNLRNHEGKRYKAIKDYIEKNESKCILLSATPAFHQRKAVL